MKRTINVHTGEIMAGCNEIVLNSDTNKSCLLIAAYDSKKKIGGMAHAIFQDNSKIMDIHPQVARDVSNAIDEMVEDMKLLGSDLQDIEVRLVTGENVPHRDHDQIFEHRLTDVIDLLAKKRIKCSKETAVDIGAQHVALDVETGKIIFK